MKGWYGIVLVLFGVCTCVCATGVFFSHVWMDLYYPISRGGGGVGVMYYDTQPIQNQFLLFW